MTDVTYYVALPFGIGEDGPEPREAVELAQAQELQLWARKGFHELRDTLVLWRSAVRFADAVLLKAFGDVPGDLSAL